MESVTQAPPSTSAAATSRSFASTAISSGVLRSIPLWRFTSEPCSSRALTTAALLTRAAMCIGVSPARSSALTCAPAPARSPTTVLDEALTAHERGPVLVLGVAHVGLRPRLNSARTALPALACAATMRGESPRREKCSTRAPAPTSASTASDFPRRAA
jgi:hypothetical protein